MCCSLMSNAQSACDSLYHSRHLGEAKAREALTCYEKELPTAKGHEAKGIILNKMAYLNFFIGEYHSDKRLAILQKGIDLAEESMLQFGTKYSIDDYRKLSPSELKVLAESLYLYGFISARWVDIRNSTMDALRRMNDIKRPMLTILRLNEGDLYHRGAERVLGIFYMKVPAIAGGDMKLSGDYLEKSRLAGSFPVNHFVYAEWLYKSGKRAEACKELSLISDLTEDDVKLLKNGFYYESLIDVQKARALRAEYECK